MRWRNVVGCVAKRKVLGWVDTDIAGIGATTGTTSYPNAKNSAVHSGALIETLKAYF
jgi:hypothetical protein